MNPKNRLIIVSIIALLCLILIILNSPNLHFVNVFISPDENADFFFAKLYVETGSWKLSDPIFAVSENIKPRNAVNIGEVVPKSFLGSFLFKSPLLAITGYDGYDLIILVFVCISITLLAYRIIPPGKRIFAIVVILISPLTKYFDLKLLLFFLIFYFIYTKKVNLLLFAIFAGALIVLRYEYLIFLALPILILTLLERKISTFVSVTAIVFLFLSSILIFSNMTYGSPFSIGYLEDSKSSDTNYFVATNLFDRVIGYILPYSPSIPNLVRNVMIFLVLLFPPFIWGMSLFLRNSFAGNYRNLIYLIPFFLSLAYYGFNPSFFVSDENVFSSSYVRYYLPISFGFIILGFAALKFNLKMKQLVLCLSLILILNFMAVQQNLSTQTLQKYGDLQFSIIKSTSSNSIILTDYWDKALWPHRYTLISSLINNSAELDKVVIDIWNFNYSVYVMTDSIHLNYIKNHYTLMNVNGTSEIFLIKHENR